MLLTSDRDSTAIATKAAFGVFVSHWRRSDICFATVEL